MDDIHGKIFITKYIKRYTPMRKNIMSQMKQITMVHVKVKEIYQIAIKQMVLVIGVFDAREFGRN